MAVTYATFIIDFPSFSAVEQETIDAKIADAESRCGETAYGDQYDAAVKYLAAHLLTIAPFGMQVGPQDSPARSSFGDEYEKIKLGIPMRGQISGGLNGLT
jgi:hypothetical protein